MEINKSNRTDLKKYFQKGDNPTEQEFADFIDAGINQAEDGIAKVEGNPLAIQAEGGEVGTQEILDLYTNFGNKKPDWSLNLNPRVDSLIQDTSRLGLNIKDGNGKSHLFIKAGEGHIGMGTIEPKSRLTIHGKNTDSLIAAVSTNTVENTNTPVFEVIDQNGDGMLSMRGASTGIEEVTRLSGSKEKSSFFLGKVGVGTNSPDTNVHLYGENAALKVTNTKKNGKTSIVLNHDPATNKQWEITVPDENGMLLFRTANSNTITLKNGKLGIGGVTPIAPLSIQGTGNSDNPDQAMHITNSSILFGGSNANGSAKSAKIIVDENSLKIYGKTSGTNGATKKLDIFGEGGITIHGRVKKPVSQVVAFAASLNADMGNEKLPLTFGEIHYNHGNHFKSNKRFEAPVKGLYLFIITLRSFTDNGTIWHLRLNETDYVNESSSGENKECSMISTTKKFHSASRSIITMLEAKDKVFVHQTKGGSDNYSSSFEGVLIQALI